MKLLVDKGRFRLGRTAIVLCLISNLSPRRADSLVSPEGGELLAFIASEQQRGSVLTYTQSYTDDQGERVSYTGTLYTGIRALKLDKCQMMAGVAVEDRYSGTIGHHRFGRVQVEHTGDLTDDSAYEYGVDLSELSPDRVLAVRAVPPDLNIDTIVRCQEDRFCNLDWIQITTAVPIVAETRTVNGFQNLNLRVRSMVLPISSQESAVQGAKLFSALIRTCSIKNGFHE
jgi:hypothetical protein